MYLWRRGHNFWFRKACPVDLARVLGREIRCSLYTEQRAVVRLRGWALLVAWSRFTRFYAQKGRWSPPERSWARLWTIFVRVAPEPRKVTSGRLALCQKLAVASEAAPLDRAAAFSEVLAYY